MIDSKATTIAMQVFPHIIRDQSQMMVSFHILPSPMPRVCFAPGFRGFVFAKICTREMRLVLRFGPNQREISAKFFRLFAHHMHSLEGARGTGK
jgi:hypothetical protein